MGVTEGVREAVGVIVGVPVVVALGVMVAVIEAVKLAVGDGDRVAPVLRAAGEGVSVTTAEGVGVPVPEPVEEVDGVLVRVGEGLGVLLFGYCNSSSSKPALQHWEAPGIENNKVEGQVVQFEAFRPEKLPLGHCTCVAFREPAGQA